MDRLESVVDVWAEERLMTKQASTKLVTAMPPKSIFRQPGAKHFQLVHRSQRDPLIHDPDATVHVLKPVVRDNDKKVTAMHN